MSEWRPIGGFEGIYEVSDEGGVRRIAPGPLTSPGRLLRPRPSRKGYVRVVLHNCGQKREAAIHRLVAEAFLPEATDGRDQVNHIDGDKTNNRRANLEWVTGAENMRHSLRTGLHVGLAGESNGRAKLTAGQVEQIRASSETGTVLAARFDVSTSLIFAIRSGEIWREVSKP